MILVDVLSDTIYRGQAVTQLDQLLDGNTKFPVKTAQIYGLRQIARQQPDKVKKFANHQGQRAQSRYDKENRRRKPRTNVLQSLQAEIDFWSIVANLCSDSVPHWSVPNEGQSYLPLELQNSQDTSRRERRELRTRQKKWFEQWKNDHIPAFFERFCTHCLYYIAKSEMGQLGSGNTNETDQLSQQEQNNNHDGGAMQTALQQVNLVE